MRARSAEELRESFAAGEGLRRGATWPPGPSPRPGESVAFVRGDDECRRLDAAAKIRAGRPERLAAAIGELRESGWFPWEGRDRV